MTRTSAESAGDADREATGADQEATASATPAHPRLREWFDTRFRSATAIYGLIVFAALLTIASDEEPNAWEVLETAAVTLVVFFIAHAFAHTLTDHGEHGLRAATWHALQHASGMLYAALPAAAVMAYCAARGVDGEDAWFFAMCVTIVVLGVLGYLAYAQRGAHPVLRMLGAFGTAVLGALIVLLEYIVH